jgi:hypothetical protein
MLSLGDKIRTVSAGLNFGFKQSVCSVLSAALIIIKQLDNNTLIAKTSSCGYTPRF